LPASATPAITGITAPSIEIGATSPRDMSPKWVLESLPPVGLSLRAMYCIMTSRGLTPRTNMAPRSRISGPT
jgi:hypothetical protein